MNKNLNDDTPLFNKKQAKTGDPDKLAIEKVKQDGRRFNKLVETGIKTIKLFVYLGAFLVILDGFFQWLNLDNSLIKDSFSLVKYSLTTVLGFVFANNLNKS